MTCLTDCDYPNVRRMVYDTTVFIPICVHCHRFVRADIEIFVHDHGLSGAPNATCSKCGRTQMHFDGYVE